MIADTVERMLAEDWSHDRIVAVVREMEDELTGRCEREISGRLLAQAFRYRIPDHQQ